MNESQSQSNTASGRQAKALGDCSAQTVSHAELLEQLMDPLVPKSDREQAAVREIERLRVIIATHALGHSHECVRCGFCYTPAEGSCEDCPSCGCDGTVDD